MMPLEERVRIILASPSVLARRAPTLTPWPFDGDAPADTAGVHAVCDGLELADGTRFLGREEVGIATKWLRDQKSLLWDDDMFIIAERDDTVIVRDMDLRDVRSGGGVLEAATDDLEALDRVALDIVGYLESRIGIVDPNPAPEPAARLAIANRDDKTLAHVLSRPFYPGNEAKAIHAALMLGDLLARKGEMDGALSAFVDSAALRVRFARRGAEAMERAAAFRAAARVAEAAGAKDLAEVCRARATAG